MSGLALPPNGRRPSKERSEEISVEVGGDTFMQSDEFLDMIGQNAFADLGTPLANDPDFDDLFPPIPDFANPDQISPFATMLAIDTQAQMPTPPVMEPNVFGGPRYHPEVGWYFTAQPGSGLSTPMPPLPFIQDGYTPASSMPPSLLPSAMPSGATTPNPFMLPPKLKNSKRKYGPAAFLEEQAKKRVAAQREIADLPPPSFDFSAKKKEVSHPLHNRKQPPVIQNCVCTDKEALKIKRPKNAFIIYRSTVSKQIIASLGKNDNQSVSKIAGEWWRKIKDTQEGKKYFRLAEEEAARHQQLYPDYKYRPGQSARNKFGSSHCTCGAYEANLKAMRESDGIDSYGHQHDDDDEMDDDDLFVPPVSSRPAVLQAHDRIARANAAAAALASIPDLASLGLPANQQAGAQAHIDALKRKRDAAEIIDVDADEPLAKRRSPRNSTKDVDYCVPSEEDIFRPLTPENGRMGRPSQAGFLNSSPPMFQAGISWDSPARNTRSRSISRARSESPSQIIRQTVYPFEFDDEEFAVGSNPDWDAIFGDSGLTAYAQNNEAAAEAQIEDQDPMEEQTQVGVSAAAESDDDDCIVVAQRRSTRGKPVDSQASPVSPTMTTRSKKSSIAEQTGGSKASQKARRSERKIGHASIASKARQ